MTASRWCAPSGIRARALSDEGAPKAGVLFLVVGPSGAGKDTVIDGARAALSGDPTFVFPRRIVTRPEGRWEKHDSIDEAAFAEAETRGDFVLSWQAHGLRYGVPAFVSREIDSGKRVVVNTSRAIIPAARTRFSTVRVVLVTAPAEVLAARIATRGRDAGVPSRAQRAEALNEGLEADCTIVNDRTPEEAVARMVAYLMNV
ncbi:MAG: phosphonate metabolism protein/1,5-bisphosphokinase (PRPP-forming) PhnN [Beijerinckiaceae bacterium]|nr:phosphonate metabolism protein/1,5-bisphosphokinase (PRPP-forming) PhnN [Beijerinckiaceae bacterium]